MFIVIMNKLDNESPFWAIPAYTIRPADNSHFTFWNHGRLYLMALSDVIRIDDDNHHRVWGNSPDIHPQIIEVKNA